ncbi:DNA polymerase ligase N-terminal domain-containing protein [Micromonospora sp. NPDC049559]|uniref:DNA polymerase ligase N-terminal domain-containing protein n=1 Tax=Micromonospora sp. NPDC049559 TaxID=3155923 RepID=UPI0034425577
MGDRLDDYRRKRDAARTPEPVPERAPRRGRDDRFVIQQHHARRLHWDLRLERDGVLVSWAVPRGLPRDQGRNHLAVHTEDHPLEYLTFAGEIPSGEYGAGQMKIFDRGRYHCEKWREDEVQVTLRGKRVSGRYVLFQTRGKDWMVRRMDPPPAGWTGMPELVHPMRPVRAARLPADDDAWAYELCWTGTRAIGYVSGGRLRLLSGADGADDAGDADDAELTRDFPGSRALAESLAPTEAVLDGVLVTLGGTPQYLIFDLLWLEGADSTGLPYAERRELLDGLALAGPYWQTPPHFTGGGRYALRTSREQGLAGVVAKRLDSPYRPGRASRDWLAIAAR